MASLIFLLSILSLLVLIIILILKASRGRPLIATFKKIGWLIAGYTVAWIVFRILWIQVPVPFGTDICFDDWCATITGYESGATIQKQFSALGTESDWLVLHVRMPGESHKNPLNPGYTSGMTRDGHGPIQIRDSNYLKKFQVFSQPLTLGWNSTSLWKRS
jgi:hypothetical protein